MKSEPGVQGSLSYHMRGSPPGPRRSATHHHGAYEWAGDMTAAAGTPPSAPSSIAL